MSEKRAKRIRKLVYGDLSTRVKYHYITKGGGIQLLADNKRKEYQNAKREVRNG